MATRQWYLKNQKREQQRGRDYYKKNKKRLLKQHEQYVKLNPNIIKSIAAKARMKRQAKKYNIPFEVYKLLLVKHPFCDICKNTFTIKEPCLDHDHTTGKLRGFLCKSCNFGLGNFKDQYSNLLKAADYLSNNLSTHYITSENPSIQNIDNWDKA